MISVRITYFYCAYIQLWTTQAIYETCSTNSFGGITAKSLVPLVISNLMISVQITVFLLCLHSSVDNPSYIETGIVNLYLCNVMIGLILLFQHTNNEYLHTMPTFSMTEEPIFSTSGAPISVVYQWLIRIVPQSLLRLLPSPTRWYQSVPMFFSLSRMQSSTLISLVVWLIERNGDHCAQIAKSEDLILFYKWNITIKYAYLYFIWKSCSIFSSRNIGFIITFPTRLLKTLYYHFW